MLARPLDLKELGGENKGDFIVERDCEDTKNAIIYFQEVTEPMEEEEYAKWLKKMYDEGIVNENYEKMEHDLNTKYQYLKSSGIFFALSNVLDMLLNQNKIS